MDATLKQSSELKDFLNEIINNISSFPNLREKLNDKLIYLNGKNSLFKFMRVNGKVKIYTLDYNGGNNFTLIQNVANLNNSYEIFNKGDHINHYINNILLEKLNNDFLNNFEWSKPNYIAALTKNLNNDV